MTDLTNFAKRYAAAWCSQNPDAVAAFYAEDGVITVNGGAPAVGRAGVASSAKGFMTAFPDLIVTFDSLKNTPLGVEFHWTLMGTNAGPGGTGKNVRISGHELWQFDTHGLVKESIGYFDTEEYNRQVNSGVN
jgi:steroid delta-isomerase-like uncharacterized protein